jgi:predicted Kef-type K+ transport protein
MHTDPVVFTVFLVFTGAAVFATVALAARQSLLVAYILLGVLLGPSVLGVVSDAELVRSISEFGILFLLSCSVSICSRRNCSGWSPRPLR